MDDHRQNKYTTKMRTARIPAIADMILFNVFFEYQPMHALHTAITAPALTDIFHSAKRPATARIDAIHRIKMFECSSHVTDVFFADSFMLEKILPTPVFPFVDD